MTADLDEESLDDEPESTELDVPIPSPSLEKVEPPNHTIPWGAIGSVLGCLAVVVGVVATLCQCKNKYRSGSDDLNNSYDEEVEHIAVIESLK
jgi:hypothetical protein